MEMRQTTHTGNRARGQAFQVNGDVNGSVTVNYDSKSLEECCVSDLLETDPREVKRAIEKEKGEPIPDLYDDLYEDPTSLSLRYEDPRSVCVQGDRGKGKTMLLCRIINDFHSSTKLGNGDLDSLLAFFFCQKDHTFASILRGLVFLLVEQAGQLVKYILPKYKRYAKRLFEDECANLLSDILKNMLNDANVSAASFVVDGVDQLAPERRSQLMELIAESSQPPKTKWIVSSRSILPCDSFSRYGFKFETFKLNGDSTASAVDKYIDMKLSEFDWLSRHDGLRQQVRQTIREKARQNFLWVDFVCIDLQFEDELSVLCLLDDMPMVLEEMERLFKRIRSLDEIRKSWAEKPSEEIRKEMNTKVLNTAIDRYTDLKKEFGTGKRRHRIGILQACMGPSDCYLELTHRRGVKDEEKIEKMRQAEAQLAEALELAEETKNERRVDRVLFDKTVLDARRIVLGRRLRFDADDIVPEKAAVSERLTYFETKYAKGGPEKDATWARAWITQLWETDSVNNLSQD